MLAVLIALVALGVAFAALFYSVDAKEARATEEIRHSADALPWHKPEGGSE